MNMTRREFVASVAAAAAGAVAAGPLSADVEPAVEQVARSSLVCVFEPRVIRKGNIDKEMLKEMLDAGLGRLTGELRLRDAWRKLIRPGQKVLVKFNRTGAGAIGTTPDMAQTLLASMAAAGISRTDIMLLDVPPDLVRRTETVPPMLGYGDKPVSVLGRDEHLSAAVEWADCIINVPFIKDHYLTGVTCGLKNLSHGLIKTPARWHTDRCRESIPHLFNLPQIRGKLKLTICNALRIVYDGGPEASLNTLAEHNRLLLSFDTVAVDAYAARLIDQVRGTHGLKDLGQDGRPPDYLRTARNLGLGQDNLDSVAICEIEP